MFVKEDKDTASKNTFSALQKHNYITIKMQGHYFN